MVGGGGGGGCFCGAEKGFGSCREWLGSRELFAGVRMVREGENGFGGRE
jgi:hypothetical protein